MFEERFNSLSFKFIFWSCFFDGALKPELFTSWGFWVERGVSVGWREVLVLGVRRCYGLRGFLLAIMNARASVRVFGHANEDKTKGFKRADFFLLSCKE